MPGELFLDTTVLVYAFLRDRAGKASARQRSVQRPGACCSIQNLNELANALIRKFGDEWLLDTNLVKPCLQTCSHGDQIPV